MPDTPQLQSIESVVVREEKDLRITLWTAKEKSPLKLDVSSHFNHLGYYS